MVEGDRRLKIEIEEVNTHLTPISQHPKPPNRLTIPLKFSIFTFNYEKLLLFLPDSKIT